MELEHQKEKKQLINSSKNINCKELGSNGVKHAIRKQNHTEMIKELENQAIYQEFELQRKREHIGSRERPNRAANGSIYQDSELIDSKLVDNEVIREDTPDDSCSQPNQPLDEHSLFKQLLTEYNSESHFEGNQDLMLFFSQQKATQEFTTYSPGEDLCRELRPFWSQNSFTKGLNLTEELGISQSQVDYSQNEVDEDHSEIINQEMLPNKELQRNFDNHTQYQSDNRRAYKSSASPLKRRKATLKGKSTKLCTSILQMIDIDYSEDDELYLKRYKLNRKAQNSLSLLSYYELNNFLSCFNHIIKLENTRKNVMILKIIMSCFKHIPENFFQQAASLKKMLQDVRMSVVELQKYEVSQFSQIQETKFKIVLSLYHLILQSSQCSRLFNIMRDEMNSSTSIIEELVVLKIKKSSRPVLLDKQFQHHTFNEKFNDHLIRKPNKVNQKVILFVENGVIEVDKLHYIIYYLLQLIRILVNCDKKLLTDTIRVLLLSSLVLYDDVELIEIYNQLDINDTKPRVMN